MIRRCWGRCGWRSRAAAIVLAVSISLAVGGCGGGAHDELETSGTSPTTADPGPSQSSRNPVPPEPNSTAVPTESTTTLIEPSPPPTTAARVEPDSRPDGGEDPYYGNPNVRDGGLGSLCWSSWEVGRHFILYAVRGADLSRWASDFRASLELAAEEMSTVLAPPDVARFVDWLRSAIAEATRVVDDRRDAPPEATFEQAGEALAFEYAPEVRTYVQLADADASCARP